MNDIQHNNDLSLSCVSHFIYYYAECRYAECHYAVGHGTNLMKRFGQNLEC